MEDRYLFRAKRIDNGEWAQGNLLEGIGKMTYIVVTAETDCNDGENTDLYATEWYRVDPSTICQCTGLRDKTGKLIWENDIVRHYNNPSHPNEYDIGLILFQEDSPGFERTSRMHDDNVGICSDCIYEVIGNVFDNPELLEV